MKITVLIARILLGLVFCVYGLNHILHFHTMEPMVGDAAVYADLLIRTKYMTFVGLLEVGGGLLLLVGRYVPLGLVILGPVLVNILLFHLLIEHSRVGWGLVLTVVELFLIWAYRLTFRGLFDASPKAS